MKDPFNWQKAQQKDEKEMSLKFKQDVKALELTDKYENQLKYLNSNQYIIERIIKLELKLDLLFNLLGENK